MQNELLRETPLQTVGLTVQGIGYAWSTERYDNEPVDLSWPGYWITGWLKKWEQN